MARQKIGKIMLYLSPRLVKILDNLAEELNISRNGVIRALLSYILEHPEIINTVFPEA